MDRVTSLNEKIFKIKYLTKIHKKDWKHYCLLELLVNTILTVDFVFYIRKCVFTTPYCLHSVLYNTHKTGLKLFIPTGCQRQFPRSCGFYKKRNALSLVALEVYGLFNSPSSKSAAEFEKTYRSILCLSYSKLL